MLYVLSAILTIVGALTLLHAVWRRLIPHIRPILGRLLRIHCTSATLKVLTSVYSSEWGSEVLFCAHLVTDAATPYPFLTQRAWLFETSKVPNMCTFSNKSNSELPINKFFIWKRRLVSKLWDGPLYFLDGYEELAEKNHLFRVSVGSYYQYVTECKGLESHALRVKEGCSLPDVWPSYPEDGDLMKLKPTAAGIGIAAVVMGPDDGDLGPSVILQLRSAETVSGGMLWTPAPTFAFQPFGGLDPLTNLSLEKQLYREIAEELFGQPEAEERSRRLFGRRRATTTERFTRYHQGVTDIGDSIASGRTQLVCLGFGLDGCNLEPTIALLLWIMDKNVFRNTVNRLNENFETQGKLEVARIQSPEMSQRLAAYEFTPSAAFALTRAAEYLEKYRSLPLIEVL